MANGGAAVNNLAAVTFMKGTIYGTINDTAEITDGIIFGGMQKVSFNHAYGMVEARGPEGLAALAVGITEENLTGDAESLALLPAHSKMIIGGNIAVVAQKTRLRKFSNSEPKPFDLHAVTPADGTAPDYEVIAYGCLAQSYKMAEMTDRAFVARGFTFKAFGRSVGGAHVLFDELYPGTLTDSSTGAGQMAAIS